MNRRIQVVIDADEKLRFHRAARQDGLSVSAWMKECARRRLEEKTVAWLPDTAAKLREFFEGCDRMEGGEEPDWSEHERVIAKSKSGGLTDA
jgi:hypothetical protein